MRPQYIPFSLNESDGDDVLACPCCGNEYTHLCNTTVHSRRDGEDGESDAINVTPAGFIHVSKDIPNPSLRRDAVVLHFDCEAGCLFDLQFVQHKGNTYVEMHVIREGDGSETL